MSDRKVLTERDVVVRERAAWAAGWLSAPANHSCSKDTVEMARAHAKQIYPLPRVTRPRVVADPHGSNWTQKWRVRDGAIEWEKSWDGKGDKWVPLTPQAMPRTNGSPENIEQVTNQRIAMWADLLARPTEECEAE